MSYIKTKIYLSEGQKTKLKSALRNNEEVSLQIDKSKTPNYEMLLTKTQLNHLNEGKRIKISKTQLNKNGGFLPFLIPILTSLGLGAASGAAGWGTKKLLDKISGSGGKGKNLSAKTEGFHPKKKNHGKGTYQNWEFPTK